MRQHIKAHTQSPKLCRGDRIDIDNLPDGNDDTALTTDTLFNWVFGRELAEGCSCAGLYVDFTRGPNGRPVLVIRHFQGCPRLAPGRRSHWRL